MNKRNLPKGLDVNIDSFKCKGYFLTEGMYEDIRYLTCYKHTVKEPIFRIYLSDDDHITYFFSKGKGTQNLLFLT